MKQIAIIFIFALLFSCTTEEIHENENMNNKETSAPYKIGSYYNEDGVEGVVYEISNNGYNGKIVSLDETDCKWSSINETTGANSSTDGVFNTQEIQKISGYRNKYPGFVWCEHKNANGDINWYYPAIEELTSIYNTWNDIESTLIKYGTNLYAGWHIYSSSTESNSNYIMALDFKTGEKIEWYKSVDFNLSSTRGGSCPIRAIKVF